MIMFITFGFLCLIFFLSLVNLLMNFSMYMISWKFLFFTMSLDLELYFNIWNLLFLLLVVLISSSVLIFSFAYMNGLHVSSFILLYLSFIFSMLWLILSNNFYWMMLGWDGLGVVSFLLIIFYSNLESSNNGLFTLFQNRIGDLFFVVFIVGSMNLIITSGLVMKIGMLVLILGSCVKSAQFPFNAWLLAAMSAPTPISSLVHSSTLVVAGVFILLQYSYCLFDILDTLKFISILSLILSSFGLLNEGDMKKLIAYSTMNHVSLMMYMYSFKLFKVVYFHLNIHAMFKSLMFMCFGFVMLSSFHAQDKRLVTYESMNPLVKIIYYFSCLCLGGLPFLSAFFSKDLMIEKLMEFSLESIYIILLMLFLSLSIYYSVKLLKLYKVLFVYKLVEKNFLGWWSVLIMSFSMIVMINLYLTLVFSLTLEFFSMKIYIYLLIIFMCFMSLSTNWNFKLVFYSKLFNFKEIWSLPFYSLDMYIYANIFYLLNYVNKLSMVKLFLVVNWWVIILSLMIF